MQYEQTPLPFTPHEAWSHMRDVLDREMPEKKKRRRVLLWWLLPVLLAGGGIWLGTARHHKTGTNGTANTGAPTTLAQQPAVQKPSTPAAGKPQQATGALPVTTNKTGEDNITPAPQLQPTGLNIQTGSKTNGAGAGKTQPIATHPVANGYERPYKKHKDIDSNTAMPVITAGTQILPPFATVVTGPEMQPDAYSLYVPVPAWRLQAGKPPGAAAQLVPVPIVLQAPVATATGKPASPAKLQFGIRSGLVLNNLAWAGNRRPLFPQRTVPLELFAEQPLGPLWSAEAGINLFSSRRIYYRQAGQQAGFINPAEYRFSSYEYTARALHFADIQLLLNRNLHHGWRLHAGMYASVLKNIAVQVNNYDSTSSTTTNGSNFKAARQTGYTYARKISAVDMKAPFRKTDMGLVTGISYGYKRLQAGLSGQWGIRPLYRVPEAAADGPRRTLQLKCWLDWRLGR